MPVPAPNGADDTVALQTGLDACVAHGAGCTVLLQAGTYQTRQLVANDFRGTFRGAGEGVTILDAIPGLAVDPDFLAERCVPNTTTCRWPSLIVFIDGDIEVSDLSIDVPAAQGTGTAVWKSVDNRFDSGDNQDLGGLMDVLHFTGRQRIAVAVDRVSLSGRRDRSALSPWGYNAAMGLVFAGELPEGKGFDLLAGSLAVRDCSFSWFAKGIVQEGRIGPSRIAIGGSPSDGNRFDNVEQGIDLGPTTGSTIDVSYNVASTSMFAVEPQNWAVPFTAAGPSRYAIHDNTFPVVAGGAQLISLRDDPAHRWIRATIERNTISAQSSVSDGIAVTNTVGTEVTGNTITGRGTDAIGVYASTGTIVRGNAVGGFTPSPFAGQIYLDQTTTMAKVTCAAPTDSVRAAGSSGTVTGCSRR